MPPNPVDSLTVFERDHRRLQALYVVVFLLAAVIGVLLYLNLSETGEKADSSDVSANTARIAATDATARKAARKAIRGSDKAARGLERANAAIEFLQGERNLPNVPDELGQPGEKGLPGLDGSRGPEGPQGPQGERGPAGADGADGATGPVGPVGPEGPQGLQGERGPGPTMEEVGAAVVSFFDTDEGDEELLAAFEEWIADNCVEGPPSTFTCTFTEE